MKRILLTITALIICVPMLASAQTRGVLQGTVTDEATGEGIPGATIVIDGTSRGAAANVDGEYKVAGVVAGEYTVVISSIGYGTIRTSNVTISPNKTTFLNVKLTEESGEGTVVEVVADRTPIDANKSGSESTISREQLLNSTTNSVTAETARSSQVGSNGGIRGSRASEAAVLRDGVDVSDPISGGGLGSLPDVSVLAVEQIIVSASGFEAEYGDVLSGVFNTITRTGQNNRFEATFAYRTNAPFLYGSSSPITVKRVGDSDTDTTLPGYQLGTSGSSTYEFGVGGYLPGLTNATGKNALTFYLSGRYTGGNKTGGYKIFDMSEEFADARRDVAEDLWGYSLEPTNLSERDQQSMDRNVNLKMRYDLTAISNIEVGGEIGAASSENNPWSNFYMRDNPVFSRMEGNTVVYDTNTSLLERDMQSIDVNTIVNRLSARYFQGIGDGSSFFELQGAYIKNATQVGKKDESKEYGLFDVYDIPDITDEYDLARFEDGQAELSREPNRAIDIYETPRNLDGEFVRNPLTGLFEGPQATSASGDPYGAAFNFPSHGNSRSLEQRESQTISFKGAYETNFDLAGFSGDTTGISVNMRAGADFAQYNIRRHSNSTPWDQNPFNDVYGYESPYITSSELQPLRDFVAEPFTPFKGSVWAQSRFIYNTIVFSPGLRFDFFNPNTQKAPASRQTIDDIVGSLDTLGQASMKFQISPRVGISYPISPTANFRVNFAMMFKMPDLNILYDNAYGDAQRGNQLFGNPDIEPQKVIVYDLGYEARIVENLFIDVSAFYRDIFNQSGVTFVPAVPSPYIINTVQEYGNVRGVEITLQRQRSRDDNFYGSIAYTLQRAVGTASSPSSNYGTLIGTPDPYTGENRTNPLSEFPLSYDRTHKFVSTVGVNWRDGEGPSLGGIPLLEHTDVSMTLLWNSGTPYTRVNTRGEQIGQFNSNRFPSTFDTELRIGRFIPLNDLLGDFAGSTRLELYAIVRNVFDWTSANSYYTTTGNPDNNGTSLDRGVGEFSATEYYAEVDPSRPETFSSFQVDEFGRRYYNPYADLNLDGVVTQTEKYAGYQRLVATIQSFRGNYDTPRTVTIGARLYF